MRKRILLLVETSRSFGLQIIEGISRFALETGQWTLFLEDRGTDEGLPLWHRQSKYDGVISRSASLAVSESVSKLNVPTVELLGNGETNRAEVHCDNSLLGEMAALHLLSKGLKHFAYFSLGQNWWSAEFAESYLRTLSRHKMKCDVCPFSSRSGSAALHLSLLKNEEADVIDWLTQLPKPVGLFCPADGQAIFVLNLCQISGISVPYEIAVLGVENNATLCNCTSPPLSSITADGHEVGYQAAKLLHARIEGLQEPAVPIKIPPLYVTTRASTDFYAFNDDDVVKALRYIGESITLRISVEQIAEYVGLSKRSLIRRFNKVIGRTPEEEIHRVRMELAKTLLVETNMSVAEIADRIGYLTSEYFIRIFRRNFGTTPKEYHKRFSKKEGE
ncbi:MAG: substrate-binding domain-containing protein [Thermoguttaceae bacterium]